MTNYRNQSACANCKFVVEEEYREYVCGTEPHPRPDINKYPHWPAWVNSKKVWETAYAVQPSSVCDDWESLHDVS